MAHEVALAEEVGLRPRRRRRWFDLLYKILWTIVVMVLIMVVSLIGAVYFYFFI